MFYIALVILSIYGFGVEATFECYGMSQTFGLWHQKYTCPATAQQCYKFVCTGSPQNPFYIQKGCLDTTSTALTCTTMNNNCNGIGGTGTCYTCSTTRCNDASSLVTSKSFLAIIPILYLIYKTYF
uniref:Uncharacterized protein n=1 Tax=Acrobeloides nanus TaxID=290746 RepID=A0A914E3T1_9BILA